MKSIFTHITSNIMFYFKLAAIVLLVAIGYMAAHFYLKYEEAKGKIDQLTAQMAFDKKQKEKSDKANADLQIALNKQQEVVTRTITKIVKMPVTVQEKCMSDVLKAALEDDK